MLQILHDKFGDFYSQLLSKKEIKILPENL